MWDETRQARLSQLREAEGERRLSQAERKELRALVAERCRHEEQALEEATARREESNARLEEELRQIQEQNRQLETLLHQATGIMEITMAVIADPKMGTPFLDKRAIQKLVAELNEQMGFVPDPTATPQKAREMMRALGIRPEDNLGSRGIIAARDEG
jgi:hypothetical protein